MVQDTISMLDKRIRNTVETASSILEKLKGHARDSTLDERIESLIKTVEKCCTAREHLSFDTEYDSMDQLGVRLWNFATQLSKDDEDQDTNPNKETILFVRILGFFMIDCAELSSKRPKEHNIRLLKLALKTGQKCADQEKLTWALKIMEKAAKYHEDLGKVDKTQPTEEKSVFRHLSRDYYILRMIIAWKQSNLSTAEYMYNQVSLALKAVESTSSSECLAKEILKIGKSFLSQNVFDVALKWLRRALDVLGGIPPACISECGTELRYSVLHSLVLGCIQHKAEDSLEFARNALETMSEDWPTRIEILRLKLDFIIAENPDAVEEYHSVLIKMIHIAQFNEVIFKAILRRIQILSDKSVALACACLDDLISKRLLSLEYDDWLERAFVTRLWMGVKGISIEGNTLAALRKLVDSMGRQISKPLSPKGTHAAHILLWKVSEAHLVQEKYTEASEWCEVALHRIFDKKGDQNMSKIARRIIYCAIQTMDYSKATEVHEIMSEVGKQSPSTLYLMFKVALRTSNNQLAESCIRGICEAPSRDHRALYACAIEAHTLGNQTETLRALKYILRYMDELPTESFHKPAILRCAIRLTIGVIEHAKGGEISNVESLCRLFELASDEAKKSRTTRMTTNRQDVAFNVKELEWFSRTSFNLTLRSIEEWHLPASIQMVSTCIKFLKFFPEDIDASTQNAVLLKTSYCHFLAASLGVQAARGEDNTELRLQRYLEVKQHSHFFRDKKQHLRDDLTQDILWDLKDKLLLYEFEACIHLKDWDNLSSIVAKAEHCENTGVFQYFGDMILQSQAPDRTIMPLMKKILELLILNPNEEVNVSKLAKCVRCQVQLSLIRDPKITDQLLMQVLEWIREYKGNEKYPVEELRWLVATAWNKAVEFKGISDQANYTRFGELAMGLAKYVEGDNGKLLARLQKNYLRDNWD